MPTPSAPCSASPAPAWRRQLAALVLTCAVASPTTARAQDDTPEVTMLERPKTLTAPVSFAFGPDQKLVACGMSSFTVNGTQLGCDVVIWTTKRGKLKKTLSGHTGAVTSLAFTADGKQLVSCCASTGEVRIHDVRRGKQKRMFAIPAHDPQWLSVPTLLTDDGASVFHFAQGSLDIAGKDKRITGDLTAWDVATGKERWRRERTFAEVAAVSPDGSRLAYYAQELNYEIVDGEVNYSSPNSVVHVLDAANGKLIRTLEVGYMPIEGLAFPTDNQSLLALNEKLRRFSLADGKVVASGPTTGIAGDVQWMQVHTDARLVACNCSWSHDVHLWDLGGKQPKQRKAVLADGVQQPMRFNDDFTLVACDIEGKPALLRYPRKRKR